MDSGRSGSFTILFTAIDASFPIVWATIGDFFGRKYFATIRGTMAFFYTWGGVSDPSSPAPFMTAEQSYVCDLVGICAILLLGRAAHGAADQTLGISQGFESTSLREGSVVRKILESHKHNP